MSQDMKTEDNPDSPKRLDQLIGDTKPVTVDRGYSSFIRLMRIILPAIAVVFFIIAITWSDFDKSAVPIAKERIIPYAKNIKNELLSPRFESVNKNNQPFSITASRATQGKEGADFVYLTEPMADLMMEDGAWVAIKANKGTYQQHTEKLLLYDTVRLFHDDGYQIEAEEIRIDLKSEYAYSDQKVIVRGPEGFIESTGIEVIGDEEKIIFLGPAKVTLYQSDTLSLERVSP